MAIVTLPPYAPFHSIPGIQFLYILANTCYFCVFDISYLGGCEMTFDFDLHAY